MTNSEALGAGAQGHESQEQKARIPRRLRFLEAMRYAAISRRAQGLEVDDDESVVYDHTGSRTRKYSVSQGQDSKEVVVEVEGRDGIRVRTEVRLTWMDTISQDAPIIDASRELFAIADTGDYDLKVVQGDTTHYSTFNEGSDNTLSLRQISETLRTAEFLQARGQVNS